MPLSKDNSISVDWIDTSLNVLNYIAAASLYLKDNYLLTQPLTQDHIKERILGHWGTVPGLNVLYLTISRLIAQNPETLTDSLLITGPGHGAPAILAGSWLDDSLVEFYNGKYAPTSKGMGQLIHDFSWPGNDQGQFQSHVTPHIPGSVHEGGELGYSLGIAYGTVMDNPKLTTYCIIGDGEAETGALSASWHSNKFINPERDGAVLPILHLNGYKISGPTILATYTNENLTKLFEGFGYKVHIIDQYTSGNFVEDCVTVFETAHHEIQAIKQTWQPKSGLAQWPMIILRSKKGWTGPKLLNGEMVEDNNLSHGIPLKNPKTDETEFAILNEWLSSYSIKDYFDGSGTLCESITQGLPQKSLRLSQSPYSNVQSHKLAVPLITQFDNEGDGRGGEDGNVLRTSSDFLAQMVTLNPDIFKVFSPDESESNKLESLLNASPRCYQLPVRTHDDYIDVHGQVLEILSEQVLQCWYQGYSLTGRHGIFISYESFFDIIASQIDQYIKFRRTLDTLSWRRTPSSMIYLATSTLWRQEHNGYTHQNPSLINSLLTKHTDRINLYFPISTNTLLATMHQCYTNDAYINYITAGKTDFPQWLTMEEAMSAVDEGSRVWDWHSDNDPDVVFVTVGDYQHQETMAGMELLKSLLSNVKVRLINVQRMTPFGIPGLTTEEQIREKLTTDKPIIVNFHGYPEAIKQLFFGSEAAQRMTILGYQEQGGTTTPFDMQVLNQTSRYHVALFAAQKIAKDGAISQAEYLKVADYVELMLTRHRSYIHEHGDDMPEVKNWTPRMV